MHLKKKYNPLNLYNKILKLSRKEFLYKKLNLQDTFYNRLYLLFFHLSFILIHLNYKKEEKIIQQQIFDYFFKQIENNLRELGFGDTSVSKKMKNFINIFYEILLSAKKWCILSKSSKIKFLMKYLYFTENKDKNLINFTLYFDKFNKFLKFIPLNFIIKGVFIFKFKH